MGKSWRWLAMGAIVGLVVGWLLVRRRLTRQPQLQSGPRPEAGREDRIVLPMSRSPWTDRGRVEAQSGVKGEITLPGGEILKTGESEPPGEAAGGGVASASAAEPEDDRIELPLPAAASRPVVGDMNGTEPAEPEDALAADSGDEVRREGGADAAIPDGSVEAYCVRCKTQRAMIHVTQYVTSKNRAALKGECQVCGAGMFKFIKE